MTNNMISLFFKGHFLNKETTFLITIANMFIRTTMRKHTTTSEPAHDNLP